MSGGRLPRAVDAAGVDWPGAWAERAACKGHDMTLPPGPSPTRRQALIDLCLSCPVFAECHEWAVESDFDPAYDLWAAGMSFKERRALRHTEGRLKRRYRADTLTR